ncbi:MAG: hypothetical protein ACI9MR_002802 [Myxococcota bacterium]|jgi:hypothetical protein
MAALLPGPALGHDGLGLRPEFSSPTGLVVVTEALGAVSELAIRWTSVEVHEETTYRLYHQGNDVPPTPSVASRERTGTKFATFAADANAYDHPWDVSALPTGPYRVYVEFDEPPFCDEIELAPTVVAVHRPGDPPPLAAIVTAPSIESIIIDESAPVSLEAIGTGPLTVSIEAGDLIRDPDFPPDTLCAEFIWAKTRDVVSDVSLVLDVDAGPDRHRLDWTWDTHDVPQGAYLLRLTVTDANGAETAVYARRFINVERGGVGPIGPVTDASGGDAGSDTTDTDTRETDSGPERDGDCTGGGAGHGLSWFLGGLMLLWRRRR